jgi:hypothetical protein
MDHLDTVRRVLRNHTLDIDAPHQVDSRHDTPIKVELRPLNFLTLTRKLHMLDDVQTMSIQSTFAILFKTAEGINEGAVFKRINKYRGIMSHYLEKSTPTIFCMQDAMLHLYGQVDWTRMTPRVNIDDQLAHLLYYTNMVKAVCDDYTKTNNQCCHCMVLDMVLATLERQESTCVYKVGKVGNQYRDYNIRLKATCNEVRKQSCSYKTTVGWSLKTLLAKTTRHDNYKTDYFYADNNDCQDVMEYYANKKK